MEKKSGIYKILNIINNKIYIGSAVNIDRRWSEHKSLLTNNKHHSKYLQNSFNKYGTENFLFEVVEKFSCNMQLTFILNSFIKIVIYFTSTISLPFSFLNDFALITLLQS